MGQKIKQNHQQLDFEIRFYESLVKEKPDFGDALIPLAEAYTRKGLYQKGLACSFALVGKNAEALDVLKRALELGYNDFAHLRRDPDLAGLHPHPEFQEFLGKKSGS